LNPRGDAT